MVVTLAASDGQAEECGAGRVDAIEDGLNAELFLVDTAFLIDLGVTMEAGGNLLLDSCVRQHIARELLEDKLVKGHVAIESTDDPVAEPPNRARRIDTIAIGIGITLDVQPVPRPLFTILRRGQQPLHQPLVSART